MKHLTKTNSFAITYVNIFFFIIFHSKYHLNTKHLDLLWKKPNTLSSKQNPWNMLDKIFIFAIKCQTFYWRPKNCYLFQGQTPQTLSLSLRFQTHKLHASSTSKILFDKGLSRFISKKLISCMIFPSFMTLASLPNIGTYFLPHQFKTKDVLKGIIHLLRGQSFPKN